MKHLIIDIPYGATTIAIPLTTEVIAALPSIMTYKPVTHKHDTVYTTGAAKSNAIVSIGEVEQC